ncbi:putative oxidoreductase, aryl-alcohol dehydrogenase like protein [Rivularia sp. PCC 7116]|uniref:aldo/keto reductase n=1 Tax=Rivularia sp. PCC 7116 TaxID=373994 RepID=UPI00029EE698|nr:aldo/keto reductase [Rivularia sp. PCC 7116]AFY54857.1 putative oxidoreductase, aryl-alcohol dehydrogenase like protein [Rivularia sp. PCC 7116]
MEKTKLGFGCAPILGRVSKRESLQALKIAYEEGINYFDIARSYGWGEAESILGNFLAENKIPRDRVEITTKFGLVPKNNKLIRLSKNIARQLINLNPKTKNLVKSAASKVAPKVDFSLDTAKVSIEKSLKSLRTDYIDNLLLHQYDFQNPPNDITDIFNFLELEKKRGTIKNYGFSTYQSLDLVANFFITNNLNPDIIQIPCQISQKQDYICFKELTQKGTNIIVHSPFNIGKNSTYIFDYLVRSDLLNHLTNSLNFPIEKTQDIYSVLLAYFKSISSPYAIVTSMFNLSHIRKNKEIIDRPVLTQKQAELFKKILSEIQAS